MTGGDSVSSLLDQLDTESELLRAGNYTAVLEGLEAKRSLIERAMTNLGDPASRLAIRTAARRQQALLRAALAGLNAARSHLLSAASPKPVSSYSRNGAMRDHSPGSGTTLKKL